MCMMSAYFPTDPAGSQGTNSIPTLQMQILRPMVAKSLVLIHTAGTIKPGFKYGPSRSKSIAVSVMVH